MGEVPSGWCRSRNGSQQLSGPDPGRATRLLVQHCPEALGCPGAAQRSIPLWREATGGASGTPGYGKILGLDFYFCAPEKIVMSFFSSSFFFSSWWGEFMRDFYFILYSQFLPLISPTAILCRTRIWKWRISDTGGLRKQQLLFW